MHIIKRKSNANKNHINLIRFKKYVPNAYFQKHVSKRITKCVYNAHLQNNISKYTFDAFKICLN